MTEEVEHLDGELDKIVAEVREGYAKLQEMKGNNTDIRTKRVDHLTERIARAKQMLKGLSLELRTVLQEAGREAYDTYDKKRQAHQDALDKLAKDIDVTSRALEKKELLADKQGRLVKSKQFDAGAAGSNEIIEQGKRVQEAGMGALARTEKLVADMEGIGAETNIALHQQTDQIKDTNAHVEGTQAGINAASKKVRDIARRLATDKLIMCMIVLLILAIIGIIVVNSLGLIDGNGAAVDCSLDITMTTSACREAEAEAAANMPPVPTAPGTGTGGGAEAGGNETSVDVNGTNSSSTGEVVEAGAAEGAEGGGGESVAVGGGNATNTARRLLFVGWTLPLADARGVELGDGEGRGGLEAYGVFAGVCVMIGLVRGGARRRR